MSSTQLVPPAPKDTHPYENQILGAFMVGVGIGVVGSGLPAVSTSMTQQTPLDTDCNDLIVGAAGFIAIEFKRTGNNKDRAAEIEKLTSLDELKSDTQWDSMLDRSKDMHFVAYYTKNHGDAGIRLEPYLHWVNQSPRTGPPENAQTLINAIFEPMYWRHSRGQLADYLKWLRTHKKRKGPAARVDETYSMVVATNQRRQVTTFQFEQFIAWSEEIDLSLAKNLNPDVPRSDTGPKKTTPPKP